MEQDYVGRRIDSHERRLDSHSNEIRDMQLWRAKTQGFLLALTVFASLPTVLVTWLAITGGIEK